MVNTEHDELNDLQAQVRALRGEGRRSAAMTAEIIAAFGEAFRRERRMLQKGTDTPVADVALSMKIRVALPLGVKEQGITLAPSQSTRRVSATALCSDASEVVVLRLTFESSEAERVRDVAGDKVDDPAATRPSFLVRLIAGEEKDLFEVPPYADAMAFSVCRAGGEPCVLRLQATDLGAHVAETAENPDIAAAEPTARHGRASSKGALWKAQELLREGRPERALQMAFAYATEIERPALSLLRAATADNDHDWLANVNAYVEQFGIAPIRLERTDAPRFLRLTTEPPPKVSGGPLVTVIMPAYNAERTLELAATSILKQSWQELELIVVDDCSSDATWDVAQRLARVDPRVRVHRNHVNVGPYVGKNLALSVARGAYVTCHDADDWAHPQRIEKQVEALRTSGPARACVASWLRLDEAGRFCGFTTIGRQSHDGALRLAHVTCMIEAEFMRRYVGHWDSVRFGADGEMLERLERLLGEELLRLPLLSVLSLDAPRSLTNDAVHGISRFAGLSPTRRAYRDAWRRWHATLTDAAYIEFPQRARPFAVPQECAVSVSAMDSVSSSVAIS